MSEAVRRPCADCPWRRDAPRGHWDPAHFTAIYRSCQDDGIGMMLCHHATKLPEPARGELLCQGWVRVIGTAAIGVRLAFLRGLVTGAELVDRAGPALFKTFDAMLRANGVPRPPRNVFTPVRRR
jgi:hypothetical protein